MKEIIRCNFWWGGEILKDFDRKDFKYVFLDMRVSL